MSSLNIATKLADSVFDGWGANVCSPTAVMEEAEVLTEAITLIFSQSLLVELVSVDSRWLITLSALQDFVHDVRPAIPEPVEMVGYLFQDAEDVRQVLSTLTEITLNDTI